MTTVAIISSRPVSFLRDVLGDVSPELTLIGLSGIERYEGGGLRVVDEAQPWTAAVREAMAMAPEVLPAGVDIEDKGLSFTVHYRGRPDLADQVLPAAAALARRTGLRTRPGKFAVEIGMPVDVDKGTTVRQMAEALTWVLFAGDDFVDIAGFGALHQLQAENPAVRAFAVAVLSAEAPPTLAASADVTVDGPGGLASLLERLDRALISGTG